MFRTNAREYTIGGCYRSAAFHFVRLLPHANPISSATFNWHVSSCTWLWARKTRSTSLPGIWVNVNFTNLKKIIVRENTLLPKHVGVKCNEVAIIHLERKHLCQQLDAPQLYNPCRILVSHTHCCGCTTYENLVRHLSGPLDNSRVLFQLELPIT